MKFCCRCKEKIEKESNYFKVKSYKKGKEYKKSYYHIKCYQDAVSINKDTKDLQKKANDFLNQAINFLPKDKKEEFIIK